MCFVVCAHALACRYGKSPVYAASQMGHVHCVEALIRLKADVLKCDECVNVQL
jgi:hypothetical protein